MSITIVTHNGTFHCDEVVAYMLLRYVFPKNQLIRTRDPELLRTADILIDVGGQYNHATRRYDHHQPSFKETFKATSTSENDVTLSSAGLIWKHYGPAIIQDCIDKAFPSVKDMIDVAKIHEELYYRFFIEIDAHDNGIRQYSDNFYDMVKEGAIKQKFRNNLAMGQIVSKFSTHSSSVPEDEMNHFKQAVEFVGICFDTTMIEYIMTCVKSESEMQLMRRAVQNRFGWDSMGRIVVIEEDCTNWRQCLSKCEEDDPSERIMFIVYKNKNSSWSIRAINEDNQQFKNRRNLLPFDDLKRLSKTPDQITFVHNKLFIGSATTAETAVEMGQLSLADPAVVA